MYSGVTLGGSGHYPIAARASSASAPRSVAYRAVAYHAATSTAAHATTTTSHNKRRCWMRRGVSRNCAIHPSAGASRAASVASTPCATPGREAHGHALDEAQPPGAATRAPASRSMPRASTCASTQRR